MNKINLKSRYEFIEFASDKFNSERQISLIVTGCDLVEILANRKFNCKILKEEIREEYDWYAISKNTTSDEDIHLIISDTSYHIDYLNIMNNFILIEEQLFHEFIEIPRIRMHCDEYIVVQYREKIESIGEFECQCEDCIEAREKAKLKEQKNKVISF